MLGLERRWADADAERVPPGAGSRLEHLLPGALQLTKIGRAREEDLSAGAAECGHRAVEENPLPVDAVGQQGRVLVLGVHDDAVSLDRAEVPGRREVDSGARGPYAVQVITQRSSSGTQTARGSSKPHCSVVTPSSGASSGSRSIDQPSIPFAERATVRCEIPVRSSTRARRTVSPVDDCGARVEDRVDRIRPVVGRRRIGLAGWRRKSSRPRCHAADV